MLSISFFKKAEAYIAEAEKNPVDITLQKKVQSIWNKIFKESPSVRTDTDLTYYVIQVKMKEYQKAYIEQLYNRMARILNPHHRCIWEQKLNKEFSIRLSQEIQKVDQTVPPSVFSKIIHNNIFPLLPKGSLSKFFRLQEGKLQISTYENNRYTFVPYEENHTLCPTIDGFILESQILTIPTLLSKNETLGDTFQVGLSERKMNQTFGAGSPHHAISFMEPYQDGVGKSLIGYTFDEGRCGHKIEEVTAKNDPMIPSLFANPTFQITTESYQIKNYKKLVQWKEVIERLPSYISTLSGNQLHRVQSAFASVVALDSSSRFSMFLGLLADAGPLRRRTYKKALQVLNELAEKVTPTCDLKPTFKSAVSKIINVVARVHNKASLVTNCRYLSKRALRVLEDLVPFERVDKNRISLHEKDLDKKNGQKIFWTIITHFSDFVAWICDFTRDLFTTQKHHEKRSLKAISL